jgi:rubrerythrin
MHRDSFNEDLGTKSIERLAHFRCKACAKWWSIGDAPTRDEWHCPWCGLKQRFADKTPKHIEN